MKAVWNERLQTVVRVFLYIVLIVFLIRNTFDIYYQFAGASADENKNQANAAQEVPEAAKTAAKVFLENWYFYKQDMSPDEDQIRLSLLKKVTTEELSSKIELEEFQINLKKEQIQPGQPAGTAPTNPSDPSAVQKPKEIRVQKLDVWEAKWVDRAKGKALITLRLEDNQRTEVFYAVPVIHYEKQTWLVEALPALVPYPPEPESLTAVEEEGNEQSNVSDFDPQEKTKLQETLKGFFSSWLSNNIEGTKRYTNNKEIPTSDFQKRLGIEPATLQIEEINKVSEEPLVVKVSMTVERKDGVILPLQFFLKIEMKGDQFNILDVQL